MDPWIPLTKIDQKHRETGRQLSFWYSQGVSLGDRNLPKKTLDSIRFIVFGRFASGHIKHR